jgi:hypothetical protein
MAASNDQLKWYHGPYAYDFFVNLSKPCIQDIEAMLWLTLS